jgi:hypothetical protein
MATQTLLNNPFNDFGSIVHGQRFVGRKEALNILSQRVLGDSYGNLAIMGLPRIGKSSLAWQGVMTKKEELIDNKTIPIFFQSGISHTARSFFSQLVFRLHREMLYYDDKKYEKYASPIVEDIKTIDDDSFALSIMEYYEIVKRLGFKVIYILDEFDSVQDIFNVADFQLLRELSNNPDTKVCLVTCSRKTIQEIEAKNGAISNFYGTFKDLRLGMFDASDMNEYWERARSNDFSDSYKNAVEYYVGRHPYLLDLLNDYCIRMEVFNFDDNANDVVSEIKLQLWNQLKSIIDTLSHEEIFDKAIQLILGPVYDVTKIDEEKLLKYEFIKVVDNLTKVNILGRLVGAQTIEGTYVCFSDYFTQLLDQEFIANIDYWPLWTNTEKKIRELIKIYITETFSSDWETEIYAKYGSSKDWSDQFNLLKATRTKSIRLFPSASSNLIDYTLTRDMYNVFMAKAWNEWFGNVFSGTRKEWAAKFNYLAEIRNPMAHNNREFISKEQITIAGNYCDEILRVIGEWEAKQE